MITSEHTTDDPMPPQALVQSRYCSAEALSFAKIDVPTPKRNEVVVRVVSVSINAGDWFVMTGTPYIIRLAMGIRKPRIPTPGRDAAGVIVACGSAVSGFSVGDEVFGEMPGALASYVVTKTERIAKRPKGLSFDDCAALPVAATTALQSLRKARRDRSPGRVLVNGAAGGVGLYTVQLAKLFGCHVTAVCSKAGAKLVHHCGADEIVDYNQQSFVEADKRYDTVIDLVGNHSLASLRKTLTSGGTVVLVAGAGNKWIGPIGRIMVGGLSSPFVSGRVVSVMAKTTGADLAALSDWVVDGSLVPPIQRRYSFNQAPEALAYQGSGHAHGKSIVQVDTTDERQV